MSPADDFGIVGFLAKALGGGSSDFSRRSQTHVIFKAANE